MIIYTKEILNLALRKYPNTKRIVLLVSSGVDSVSGSHFFINKIKKQKIFSDFSIKCLHFNHQLRNQNDIMQEKYNQYIDSFEDKSIGLSPIGILDFIEDKSEDGFRKARINYLNLSFNNTIFITFHHLNDAVESYMMNVIRGKEGYLPIPFITELNNNNVICHPFVLTTKNDFIDYSENKNLSRFIEEDETNKIVKGSRRNMIRNEIVPILNKYNVGLHTIVKKNIKKRLFIEVIKS
jgi:tRNA(Ile)-lysidine synthase TilS/MesJ